MNEQIPHPVRTPSFSERAATFLIRLVPTGLSLPIMRGPLKGRLWIAGAAAGEGKGLSILFHRSESEKLDYAAGIASSIGGICFDIGANVGLYSLLFSRYCRRVYAFEPSPRNLRFLVRTMEINAAHNVTVMPCAVSDGLALKSFDAGANCAEGRLADGGGQPVVTISCDEFSRAFGVTPDILKIDVEGAERDVLRGAAGIIERRKPHIMIETHGASARNDCLEYLKSFGYTRIVTLSENTAEDAAELAVSAE